MFLRNGIVYILMLILTQLVMSQQFSEDIIVDSSASTTIIEKYDPVVNVNSEGLLAISWVDELVDHCIVYYVQSTTHGNTFETKKVIDDVPGNPNEVHQGVSGVYFDLMDHPILLYHHTYFPFFFFHRIAKSVDSGQSFYFLSYNQLSDIGTSSFLPLNDSTYFISLRDFNSGDIKIIKSFDEGLTFSDSTYISTDSGSVNAYSLPIIKLTNNDILCFWQCQYAPLYRNAMYYSRSLDNGSTFSPKVEIIGLDYSPFTLSVDTYENFVFLSYCTSDSDGTNVWLKVSNNFGYSYNAPKLIYNYVGSVNFSPTPTIRYEPNVGLCILWSKPVSLNAKNYFTYSKDLGNTFDSTIVVTHDGLRGLNSLAVSDSGNVYAVCTKSSPYRIVLNKLRLPLISAITQNPVNILSKLVINNYPNPFNSSTIILFELSKRAEVTLMIYDITGRKIRTLISSAYLAGSHQIQWDGRDDSGNAVASGIYVYRIEAGKFIQSRKMLLLK
jgi:hypothetical protein